MGSAKSGISTEKPYPHVYSRAEIDQIPGREIREKRTRSSKLYDLGGSVRNTYDGFKRVIGVRLDSDTSDRYVYAFGANGQVAKLTETLISRTVQSEYDMANRPMRVIHRENGNHLYTAQVAYDAYGNLSQFNEKVGASGTAYATTFGFDNQSRPATIQYGSVSNKVDYAYDALGRVSTRTLKVGGVNYASTYGFVAGGHGTGSTTPLVSSITQTGHNLTYTYDDVGNILSCTYGGMTTSYAYDTIGQLTRVNDPHDTTSGATGTSWTYEYDRGGNILNRKRYAYTTGTLGTALETISYTYDTAWKDKLTCYNGMAISYDVIGNPLTDGTWTCAWQAGRQLVSMTKTGTTASFLYNADGLRVRKTVNSTITEYTLHGKNVVHLTQGSNNLHFFYDASGRPSHVNFNGTMYLYIHNLQGDIIAIRDAAGNNVVTYSYNAWGKPLSKTGSLASTLGTLNPFRYRGYVYDEETGLYYLRSRYYNPTWCRFVNGDTFLGRTHSLLSQNTYSYCANNPVITIDSFGLEPRVVFGVPLRHASEFTEAFNFKRPGYYGYVDTPARIFMPNNIVIEGEIRQTPRAYHFDFFPDDKNEFRKAGIALGAPYAAYSVKNRRKMIVQYNPGIPIIFEVDYPDGTMRTWAMVHNKDSENEVCVWILGSRQSSKETIGRDDEKVRNAPYEYGALFILHRWSELMNTQME